MMEQPGNILHRSIGYLKVHLNREVAFYIVLTIIAFIMRMWQLGERAVHYDEGLHLGCSFNLFNPAAWCYEPWVHGPFQFIGTGVIYKVFGDTEFTARLLPAIFGTAIIILPYFLRRQLGRWGALATSVLLAFSPLLMYYSRYARGDIYHAFFTLLIVVCIWYYITDMRQRWLYTGAAALSLDFCNLETAYINLAIIGFFVFVIAGISFVRLLISQEDRSSKLKQVLGLRGLSPQADFLILLITLTLPLFGAFINVFSLIKINGLPLLKPINDLSSSASIVIVVVLFILSAAVGLRWNPRRWLISAGIFYGVFILVWSVFFTHPQGIATGLWGDAAYWISQHGVARGGQPWFYYVILIPIYEFLPLLFASAGAIYFAIKGNLFSRFLIYWFVMSFIIYSFFGERMPWISLNIVVPVAMLGGMFIGFLLKAKPWRGKLRLVIRIGVAVVVIWLFSFTAYTACRESYQSADEPPQLLMYAGVSADVPRIADRIKEMAEATGEGYALPITIDTDIYFSGWSWYLRDYSVDTPGMSSITSVPRGSVLILRADHDPADRQYLEKYGEGERIRMLIWFPEDYKGNFNVGWWWGYFWGRDAGASCLMTEGIVYFLKEDQ